MSSLNKVILIGRVGADPEVRYTQSNTAVANFSLATSEKYKDRNGESVENTEWHKCVAWARTAEILQEYVNKGDLISVEGSLQTREWEDKNGNKRYSTEVKVFSMIMLGSKSDGGGRSNGGKPQGARAKQQPAVVGDPQIDFDDLDDDLPF